MPKYCSNCGIEVRVEDIFCSNCGKKIDIISNNVSEESKESDFFDELRSALKIQGIDIELEDTIENRNFHKKFVDFIIYTLEVSKIDLSITLINDRFVTLARENGIEHTDEFIEEILERWDYADIDTQGIEYSSTTDHTIIFDILDPVRITTRYFKELELSINTIKHENQNDETLDNHIRDFVQIMNKDYGFNSIYHYRKWVGSEITGFYLSEKKLTRETILSDLSIRVIEEHPIAISFNGEINDLDYGDDGESFMKAGIDDLKSIDFMSLIYDKYSYQNDNQSDVQSNAKETNKSFISQDRTDVKEVIIESGDSNSTTDLLVKSPFVIHYFLVPLNVFLPWSIVSWIGIPLSLFAKNRLNSIKESGINVSKSHLLWTNISLGIFIFYLVASFIRAAII
jgi:hypothetical protein